MLSDPKRLKVMGQKAANSAGKRYNNMKIAQQMTTAYEDILQDKRSSELSWLDPQTPL